MQRQIQFYDEIDSTNTRIRQLATEGVKEGTVVVADKQTGGKGRRGRNWESPGGVNLYFSMLLRPEFPPEQAPMLTLVMAYSIAKVLSEKYELSIGIKWPNDLVLEKRKVCGILTEMMLSGSQIDAVIVGVGINVNIKDFPEELREKATSLAVVTGKEIDRKGLLLEILSEFESQYERFQECRDLSFLQEAYNNMLVNAGKEVLVLEPGGEYKGTAGGINSKGELLVQKEDGSLETVFAGEVSVRGIYGYV